MKCLDFEGVVSRLESAGWSYARTEVISSVPECIKLRYYWMSPNYFTLLGAFERISSADEQAWFLTVNDYLGDSDSAYSWNEWEKMSLEDARGDLEWAREITAFWDRHFPICLSVRERYQYLAIERESLSVVRGSAPEFEEVEVVGASLCDAFALDVLMSL